MPDRRSAVPTLVLLMIGMFLLGVTVGIRVEHRRPNLPATCNVGDMFLPASGEEYLCVDTNTWDVEKENK